MAKQTKNGAADQRPTVIHLNKKALKEFMESLDSLHKSSGRTPLTHDELREIFGGGITAIIIPRKPPKKEE